MSDVKIVITGDVSGLEKATKQAQVELGKTGIAAKKTDAELSSFSKTGNVFAATIPKTINPLKDMGNALEAVAKDSAKATTSTKELAGGIQKTVEPAEESASSLFEMGQSILEGGIIAGIGLAIPLLIEFGLSLFDMSEESKKAVQEQELLSDVLSGASSAYVKATLEVDNLKIAFRQAKEGIISKEEALKLYNDTIGKTTGKVNNLNEAEQALAKNANAYIEFTLLKAAANIAAAKAAEKLFQAAIVSRKEFVNTQNATDIFGIKFSPERLEQMEAENMAAFGAGKQARASALKDESDDYTKIYQDFIRRAEQIATKFKFDFNAIKEVKGIRIKPEEITIEKPERIPDFNYFEDKTLSRATGSTLTPTIVIKPKLVIDEKSQRETLGNMFKFLEGQALLDAAQEFADHVSYAVESTMEDTAIGIGEAIGRALGGEKNVIPNLFGSLMTSVGSQIQNLGKFLIKSAITVEIAKKAFAKLLANPIAAIAVGIGLIALGAILKAQAAKQFQGFASGTTGVQQGGFYNVGERGQERIFLPTGAKVQPNNEVQAYGGGQQIFIPALTLSGSDLVIAFNRASQQMGRNN